MNFLSQRPHQPEPENTKGSSKPENTGDFDDCLSNLNRSPNHHESLMSMGTDYSISGSSWANIDVTRMDVSNLDLLLLQRLCRTDGARNYGGKSRDHKPTTTNCTVAPATNTTNNKKGFGCGTFSSDDSSVCVSVSSWAHIDIDIDEQPTIPNRPTQEQHAPRAAAPKPHRLQKDARESSWGDAEIFLPPPPIMMPNINHWSPCRSSAFYKEEISDPSSNWAMDKTVTAARLVRSTC